MAKKEREIERGKPFAFVAALLFPALVYLAHSAVPPRVEEAELFNGASSFAASSLPLETSSLGPESESPPIITNVQIVDFNGDQLADVVVCDALKNRVLWYEQTSDGSWEEHLAADRLVAPAHATVVDLDQDDDLDIVVSVLGNIWPDDTAVGSLVWLEREGDKFTPHVLLDDVRRVADAAAGDLDGDGDLDLAVAVFGYARGKVLWLENRGDQNFQEHRLHYASGTIHVPIDDYDADGDLDIAAIVSQEDEEVWIFDNDGSGNFKPRQVFKTFNYDIGSAGMVKSDLDNDGDVDLLLPVGDNLEYMLSYPQPYHGCLWLENDGKGNFTDRRIATFGGVYAADAGDLDGDGDQDIVLVSMCNDWKQSESASLAWLENDGKQNFTTWQIASDPTHLVTVACADINGDGRYDIVAGRMNISAPLENSRPVPMWISTGGDQP